MNCRLMLIVLCAAVLSIPTALMASMEKGADRMELYGGTRGKVPFPHHQHQDRIGDCMKCHSMFPQNSGSIRLLKEKKELKKKKVMNTLCIKCHKAEKRAGKPSGPTTCATCHKR